MPKQKKSTWVWLSVIMLVFQSLFLMWAFLTKSDVVFFEMGTVLIIAALYVGVGYVIEVARGVFKN